MAEEERKLIAEAEAELGSSDSSDDEEEDDSDDEDLEETPRRRFQAGVERMRERSEKSKGKQRAVEPAAASDEDDSDYAMELEQTWADDDEAMIAQIEVRSSFSHH